jgi:ClpP class serine protease/predicted transcriptional regulator
MSTPPLYWLLSHEALQLRLVRAIREARTPLTAKAPTPTLPSPLTVSDGKALITVRGVLTPTPDSEAAWFGESNTLYPDLQAALQSALANKGVSKIVWDIDSPGGAVDGLFALLDDIADARGKKPMSVFADNAHSAAYGIAAAVGRITATSRMSSFGSVGVATSGFISGGLCGTVVDIASSDAPEKRPDLATAEGKAVVQRYLDQIAGEFMGTIARGRGASVETVRKAYGRGSSMLAGPAKAAGLIDGIAPRLAAATSSTATVRLPTDTLQRLDGIAAQTGASRNAIVNAAVEAGLEDFERRDADKIKDPAARARFVASRLERKRKAAAPPLPVGPDGLHDFERADAAKIKDPAARARFVASRLERKGRSK